MTEQQRHAQRKRASGPKPEPDGQFEPQSAAAPSPFPPIEQYTFLSNCHTGALVAPDGAIDWLCVPRFDSPSVFGTLLDRQAGAFRFAPFGINVPSARAYEPGTNTLLTTWTTPTGWAAVRDALTLGPRRHEDLITPHTRPPTDEDAEHLLVRVAICLDGEVEIELTCEPVFDYGSVTAEWSVSEDRHRADATGAGMTLRLQSSMSLGVEGDWVRARHVLRQGEQVFCALSWAEELQAPEDIDDANARLAATAGYWRDWLGHARLPDHRWREPIQRSALAIKGLTYMPTGATVAALTTSLPETPGGERNWDYRFTWLRDSTFTLQALHYLNLDWEAEEFMQFVADLERDDDGALQIMYGIDGRRDLAESTRDDLSGYAGAHPVRVGNGAYNQRQNDVFGAALDSILLHTRRSERLPRRLWPIVQAQAQCATNVWREPDQGIWEARGKPRHYVSSKLMCWVAMDRAAQLAAIRGDSQLQKTWAATAEEIKQDVLEHGVDKRGVLRQHYETDALDARPRQTPARQRAGDRRRTDRRRLRVALSHRRDRRRDERQGGQLFDLLLLAGVGAGDHRRGAARPRPDGTAAARRLAARPLRRGVRHQHRPAPRQLPPSLLTPRPDRGSRAHHHPRALARDRRAERHGRHLRCLAGGRALEGV
jgi:alpha,alpha-trehalase